MSAPGTQSEPPPGIHAALLAVMNDVQVLRKDSRNKAQGFSFRGIDAVLNSVGPAFRKHGIICVPRIVSQQHRDFTSKSGTVQHEALLEVEYTFIASDGSEVSCSVVGEASDASDKATTQAMSVAYRTALLQVLCLPTDTVDPDENTVDRASEDTALALANSKAILDQGWGGGVAQRAEAWNRLVALQQAETDESVLSAVNEWGRREKLGPDTLTKSQAEAWEAMLNGVDVDPF